MNILLRLFKENIKRYIFQYNKKISSQIPKTELSEKHIRNARLILNREKLLERLPKNGIVAELGVDEGSFSEKIIHINKPKRLHLIDAWASNRYNQIKRTYVENMFSQEVSEGLIEINIGLSTELAQSFDDKYFDWIYIDTAHSYNITLDELNKYSEKIKDGGIIAGHDYIKGAWNYMARYGVIEAVSKFCVENNWEIIYLTMEYMGHPSFAIKKIND